MHSTQSNHVDPVQNINNGDKWMSKKPNSFFNLGLPLCSFSIINFSAITSYFFCKDIAKRYLIYICYACITKFTLLLKSVIKKALGNYSFPRAFFISLIGIVFINLIINYQIYICK